MIKFLLGLMIFLLTPFLWVACWEGCSTTYVSFLFGKGPEMEGAIVFMLGLVSLLNWGQIILKLLVIYLSVRYLEKPIRKQNVKVVGYLILVGTLFLIPHFIYINYIDEGIRSSFARTDDKVFEINKDFDAVNRNLVKYKLEPLTDNNLLTDVFRDASVWYTKPGAIYRVDYPFKFSKCYVTTSYSVACFNQNNILVYKEVANAEGPRTMTSLEQSKDYPKRLTEQLKKCETLFTNETCALDPQTYTVSYGCKLWHPATHRPFFSLFCSSSSLEYEPVSADVFSPEGQLLCSVSQKNNNLFSLENCHIEDKKAYIIIVELNNGIKAIEILKPTF